VGSIKRNFAHGGAHSGVPRGHRLDKHPLFVGKRNVIPGVDTSELGMFLNVLKLLGLYGIPEIANGRIHERLIVDATLDTDSRDILGFELNRVRNAGEKRGCRLYLRCERGFLALDRAFVKGVFGDFGEWLESLDRKMLKKSIYEEAMRYQQKVDNDEVFRIFFGNGLGGLSPDSYSNLHAWVALDSGRILHVSQSPFPSEKYDGVQISFSADIVGATAYVYCTNRSALDVLSDSNGAYFDQTFMMISDVFSAAEKGGTHEEADDIDSDTALGA